MAKKMTTQEFIQRAQQVHGDKYDYSKVEYVNSREKVCIICKEHGEFWQTPNSHLSGQGCNICARINCGLKIRKWDEVTCFREAKKYKTLLDFRNKSASAFNVARKYEWIDSYFWLAKKENITYDVCKDEAKKYSSRADFKKANKKVYQSALSHGWINDFKWLPRIQHTPWSFDECRTEAKKYNTRKQFAESNHLAYLAARKKGWLNSFDWLVDDRVLLFQDPIDCVYIYLFENYNSVYIGRTIRKDDRDKEHLYNQDKDVVSRFAIEHNCSVPPMTIIEDNLTLKEGLEREDYWVNYYLELGFNVLNKAKTGIGKGSLGAIGYNKWTKATCYNEARKYNSRSEFYEKSGSAYGVALKNKWLNDYNWFKDVIPKLEDVWTYENASKEAKKFTSKSELLKGNPSLYRISIRNHWIDSFTWLKRPKQYNKKWNEETCYSEAKKYSTVTEFRKKSGGAYNAALRNKWIKSYVWLKHKYKPNGYWTYEMCLLEARSYNSRKGFRSGNSTAYRICCENGWIDDITWFKNTSDLISTALSKWDYQSCFEEAKKYKSRGELSEKKPSVWQVAKKNGWLDDYFWFIELKKPNGYWTYERCKEIASICKNKNHMSKEYAGAYDAAYKNGWLEEFFPKKK